MRSRAYVRVGSSLVALAILLGCSTAFSPSTPPTVFSDYHSQKPGAIHKITPKDLPAPFESKSVDNGPKLVPKPADAWPQAPPGFKVEQYATGLQNPRLIRTAPN